MPSNNYQAYKRIYELIVREVLNENRNLALALVSSDWKVENIPMTETIGTTMLNIEEDKNGNPSFFYFFKNLREGLYNIIEYEATTNYTFIMAFPLSVVMAFFIAIAATGSFIWALLAIFKTSVNKVFRRNIFIKVKLMFELKNEKLMEDEYRHEINDIYKFLK